MNYNICDLWMSWWHIKPVTSLLMDDCKIKIFWLAYQSSSLRSLALVPVCHSSPHTFKWMKMIEVCNITCLTFFFFWGFLCVFFLLCLSPATSAEWRSLGLVPQTFPSPRAGAEGVALSSPPLTSMIAPSGVQSPSHLHPTRHLPSPHNTSPP